MADIRSMLSRQRQIDLLSYALIVFLILTVGVLGFAIAFRVDVADMLLLQDTTLRTLVVGFLLTVLLYMADQQRRLRSQISERDDALNRARDDLQASVDRLTFAHHAAEVMSSLSHEDGVKQVLRDSARKFGADAAAIVGDEITVFAENPADEADANADILPVSLQCVAGGRPMSCSFGADGTAMIAVPLRVKDRLQYVCCLWRRDGTFESGQLKGLVLVARIIELCMENQALLEDAREQLQGTLRALLTLAESKLGVTPAHSARTVDLALAVGDRLGLGGRAREELRAAALLHDVGMLEVPDEILRARRRLTPEESAQVRAHAERGAALARMCSFSRGVQEAIAAHHERTNGCGYPLGLRGKRLPLSARILGACDTWDELVTERPNRRPVGREEAAEILRRESGATLDTAVVSALLDVVSAESADPGLDAAIASALASVI